MKIALLDLNHATCGIHTNTVPLGLGLLSAYLRKTVSSHLDIKLFKDAANALSTFQSWIPDIIGLAQYSWNSRLNLFVAQKVKHANPACIVIAGGPNLNLSSKGRETFLLREPVIDCCVAFDGEIPFAEFVKRRLAGESIINLRKHPVAGMYALHPHTGKLTENLTVIPRINSLDVFGAIYADNVFDEMLDQGFHPFLQTHRGCPFSCSFCHTSHRYHSKMLFLSPEIFEQDMAYLGRRFADMPHVTLYLANTNMSLFKQDFPIAAIINHTRKKYGWPHLINVNSGKNPDKLLEMLSIVDFQPGIALQTLTPAVLKNIRRKNIPFHRFMHFQQQVSTITGRPSSTELILSLPGETRQTFLNNVKTVLNSGIQNIVIYTLMSLTGTPLASAEARHRYGLIKKHRIVPRQFSRIDGQTIIETEEVVIATNTMSYEDYLELRGLSFTITIWFNSSELMPLRKFMTEQKIDIAEWLFAIHRKMENHPKIGPKYRNYLKETEHELFSSRKAVQEFFSRPENFDGLRNGLFGDNLLRKYKYDVLSAHFDDVLNLSVDALKTFFTERSYDRGSETMIKDLKTFLSTRNITCYLSPTKQLEKHRVRLNYDIPHWLSSNSANAALNHLSGAFTYTVFVPQKTRQLFSDINDMNQSYELSMQIIFRDNIVQDFWPTWEKHNYLTV